MRSRLPPAQAQLGALSVFNEWGRSITITKDGGVRFRLLIRT
jgi:hypothetical protein